MIVKIILNIFSTYLALFCAYLMIKAMVANTDLPFEKSEHMDGKRFYNLEHNLENKKNFGSFFKWQLENNRVKWPESLDDNVTAQIATSLKQGEISTVFINHITHLIQISGVNFITDPVFSKRASPFQFLGPKRHRKPGIEFDNLPKIDVVLISHNHYDHMDKDSIKKLTKKFDPIFITPIGNKKYLKNFGAKKIIELDWWNFQQINNNVKVTAVPAQHWSKRTLFDTNKALWGGFVIEAYGKKIFFSGDTGYANHFKMVNQKFGAMDLSFIPIGGYEPRWFMKDNHLNPEEAVLTHQDLQSKKSIGTHFGTFQLTDEAIDQPNIDLEIAREKYKIAEKNFIAPKNGETTLIKN